MCAEWGGSGRGLARDVTWAALWPFFFLLVTGALSFGITFGRQAEKHTDLHHSFYHLVPVVVAIADALPSPPAVLG